MKIRRILAASVAAAGLIATGASMASAQPGTASPTATQNATTATTSPVATAAPVDATSHSNAVSFIYSTEQGQPTAVQSVDFTWNGNYSITGGQPWGGVTTSFDPSQGVAETIITAQAGRHDSPAPAQWFSSNSSAYVGANAFTTGAPSELNFAFSGVLTIDGNAYNITLGQGSNGEGNNWWVGGPGWTQNKASEIISPDGQYTISADSNSNNDPYDNVFQVGADN